MNNETKLKPSTNFAASNNFINDFVKNSSEARVGAEYRIDRFKVRAGYNYVASPYENINLDVANENNVVSNTSLTKTFMGDINRASFGLGYDFGGFYIDAAYQYQTQKYQQVIGGTDYIDNSNYFVQLKNSYAPQVKLDNNTFIFTLGWQF